MTVPLVTIAVDRRPLAQDAAQKWNATYLGKPLVTRVRVPSMESCRALLAMGITGRVNFMHEGTDYVAFWLDIERGARLTVQENDEGIRVVPYKPFPRAVLEPDAIEASGGIDIAARAEKPSGTENAKGPASAPTPPSHGSTLPLTKGSEK